MSHNTAYLLFVTGGDVEPIMKHLDPITKTMGIERGDVFEELVLNGHCYTRIYNLCGKNGITPDEMISCLLSELLKLSLKLDMPDRVQLAWCDEHDTGFQMGDVWGPGRITQWGI